MSSSDELYRLKREQLETMLHNALDRQIRLDTETARSVVTNNWRNLQSTNQTLISTIKTALIVLDFQNQARLEREEKERERAAKEAKRKRRWGWLDKF